MPETLSHKRRLMFGVTEIPKTVKLGLEEKYQEEEKEDKLKSIDSIRTVKSQKTLDQISLD
jgi:hypothetical protein